MLAIIRERKRKLQGDEPPPKKKKVNREYQLTKIDGVEPMFGPPGLRKKFRGLETAVNNSNVIGENAQQTQSVSQAQASQRTEDSINKPSDPDPTGNAPPGLFEKTVPNEMETEPVDKMDELEDPTLTFVDTPTESWENVHVSN